jgi:hypothetical protein
MLEWPGPAPPARKQHRSQALYSILARANRLEIMMADSLNLLDGVFLFQPVLYRGGSHGTEPAFVSLSQLVSLSLSVSLSTRALNWNIHAENSIALSRLL